MTSVQLPVKLKDWIKWKGFKLALGSAWWRLLQELAVHFDRKRQKETERAALVFSRLHVAFIKLLPTRLQFNTGEAKEEFLKRIGGDRKCEECKYVWGDTWRGIQEMWWECVTFSNTQCLAPVSCSNKSYSAHLPQPVLVTIRMRNKTTSPTGITHLRKSSTLLWTLLTGSWLFHLFFYYFQWSAERSRENKIFTILSNLRNNEHWFSLFLFRLKITGSVKSLE